MSKGWIDLIFYVLFFSSVRVKKEERDVGEKGGGKESMYRCEGGANRSVSGGGMPIILIYVLDNRQYASIKPCSARAFAFGGRKSCRMCI